MSILYFVCLTRLIDWRISGIRAVPPARTYQSIWPTPDCLNMDMYFWSRFWDSSTMCGSTRRSFFSSAPCEKAGCYITADTAHSCEQAVCLYYCRPRARALTAFSRLPRTEPNRIEDMIKPPW